MLPSEELMNTKKSIATSNDEIKMHHNMKERSATIKLLAHLC